MKTKRLRIDRRATAELDAGVDWYESLRPGLGQELVDAVD